MRLLRLSLTNFRQFYGQQQLAFGRPTPTKNASVIYGANGSGKTTLLNGFLWTLYGEPSPDFEHREWLINNRAWAEAEPGSEVEARCTVEFEHGGRTYTMTRVSSARKSADRSPTTVRTGDVTLHYVDEAGETRQLQNPLDAVNQILPERLKGYFFFNGERIEQIVRLDAFVQIEEAIKTLLGLEVVERGTKHLDEAIRRLRGEYRDVGDDQVRQLHEQLSRLTDERERSETKLTESRNLATALRQEREDIASRLRALEATRVLQERRDGLERERRSKQEQVKHARRLMAAVINDKGYLAFITELADTAVALIEGNRVRGELPAPLKRQFVEDLLEGGECICGTSLLEDEDPYRRVAEWVARAGLADVEEAVTRLGAQAEDVRGIQSELLGALLDTGTTIGQLRAQMDALEEQLSELSRQLGDLPVEEAQALETRRESVEDQLQVEIGRAAETQADIRVKDAELARADQRLKAIREERAEAVKAQQRMSLAMEARDLLARLHSLRTQTVRQELDRLIKSVYRGISFKDYTPSLSENFQLSLRTAAGFDVARSAGESQILSLSFVGALAALAREQATSARDPELGALLGFEGGVFPIVMDSAFGTLDENYRREVAQALPKLTDQVVLFVSKAQGLGTVEQELRDRIAEEYVITYHTPKQGVERETILLLGHEFDYIVPSADDTEWASLTKVER